jgi:hypothetical protein
LAYVLVPWRYTTLHWTSRALVLGIWWTKMENQ